LIEETLVDGFVQVVIEREGVTETWRRDLARDQIAITPAFGEPLSLSLADARRRFRGRAFFQKQLSTTTSSPESAVEQITGIAAAEALDRRREIDQAIENAKRTVTTTLQQAVAHWHTVYERSWALTNAADLRARIAAIGDRLKAEGVSDAHLAIISDAPRHARGRNLLTSANDFLANEHERLAVARKHVLYLPMEQYPDSMTFPELATLVGKIDSARAEIMAHLTQGIAVVGKFGGRRIRGSRYL